MQIGVEFHSRRGKVKAIEEEPTVNEPCNMQDDLSFMQTDVVSEVRAKPASQRVLAGISSDGDVDIGEDAGHSEHSHPLFVDDAFSLVQATTFVRQGKMASHAARAKAQKDGITTVAHQASSVDAFATKSTGRPWFGQRFDAFTSTPRDYQKWATLAICALVLQVFLWSIAKASKAMLKRLLACNRCSRGKRLQLSASELASTQQASSLALDLQQQLLLSSTQAALQKKLSFTFALNQLLDHVGVDVKLSGRNDGPAFIATLTEGQEEERTLKLASAVEPARGLMSVGPLQHPSRKDGAAVYRFSTGCTIGMLKAEGPGFWSLSKNDHVSLRMASPAPLTLAVTMNGREVAWVKPANDADAQNHPHEVGATMCELTVCEGGDSVLLVSCALAALIVSSSSGDESSQ